MRAIMIVAVVFMCIGSLFAQDVQVANGDTGLQVREEDGGSVVVHTANGVLNQNSSLKRRWYAIDDLASPVRLNRVGVFTRFDEKEQLHFLSPVGTVSPTQLISAVEMRYLLFDVWGQHLRTLTLTRLVDASTTVDLREAASWPALESDVSQLVTVVAFAARVRAAEGQVWTYDSEKMLPQIRSLGLSVASEDLAPDELRAFNPRAVYWTYSPVQKGSAASAAGSAHQ